MNTVFRKILKSIVTLTLLISSITAMGVEVDLTRRSTQDTARDASSKPAEMIQLVGVKSGDIVLDLLGGGGYYSELLSRVVGEKGDVVLQIPKAYIKYVGKDLEERLKNNRLKNVTYLLSESDDLKLGEDKYNSVFLVLGYHDMFYTSEDWDFTADRVMDDVAKSMKLGGRLLVIDHNSAEGVGIKAIQSLHRIEKTFVISDLRKRGFTLVKESHVLENSEDDHTKSVFDKSIRRKTDRFVLVFEKLSVR